MSDEKNEILMQRYRKLLELVIDRESQVKKLIAFLHNETTWLICPASKRYHGSEYAGLLKHSVRVAIYALRLRKVLTPDISEESVVIAALFHDIGKIGGIGDSGEVIPRYLSGQSDKGKSTYQYNSKVIEIGLAVRSLYYLSRFVELTDAEVQAVLYHDGQYVPQGEFIAHRETPLTVLIHYADYWIGHIIEGELDQNTANLGIWKH